MKDTFIIKDGGTRTEFKSGMVRDTGAGKIDWELVFNGPMLERWAVHLTKGNAKYPDPEPGKANWQRACGIEEQVRFRKGAARHFAQWMRGDDDEDHAAAAIFNINGYEYVKALRAVLAATGLNPLPPECLAKKAPTLDNWLREKTNSLKHAQLAMKEEELADDRETARLDREKELRDYNL